MVLVVAALALAGLIAMRVIRHVVRWVLGAALLVAAVAVFLAWPRPVPVAAPSASAARILAQLNQGYAAALTDAATGDTRALRAETRALSARLQALGSPGAGASSQLLAYLRAYRTFLGSVTRLMHDALGGDTAGESRELAIVTREGQTLSTRYQALVRSGLAGP